ncbi:unnamed protein product [Durusdinium trenchii]|uniref:Uncharacterized protein n=1 Tax=Durusdinium trenchii TaxID=1381693 RepID=A0ABP0P862_9DINO
MESCGNVCDWLLCGEWPDPGPGLCQEPSSSCSRKDFLESLGSILPLEEQEQPWFYFAGDSTGRQLWAAFLKDVAKINLGNFVQVKTRVSNCPKTPPPDKRLQRFVNANARQVDLQPNWTSAGDRICDWNVSFGQRSVRVTYDWRRFISDSTNDLHVLEEVAKAGRWPTAWVVISGVHDCYYLRRNLAFQASSTKGFFSFLEQQATWSKPKHLALDHGTVLHRSAASPLLPHDGRSSSLCAARRASREEILAGKSSTRGSSHSWCARATARRSRGQVH